MYWLKGCPRCRGDLYSTEDIHGKFFACLQCGHYLNDQETDVVIGGQAVSPPATVNSEPEWVYAELAG